MCITFMSLPQTAAADISAMPTGNGGPAERFDIGEGTSLGEIARYRCIRNEKLGSGHFANVYAVENIR